LSLARRYLAPPCSTSRLGSLPVPGPFPTRVILSQAFALLQSVTNSRYLLLRRASYSSGNMRPFAVANHLPKGLGPFSVFLPFGASRSGRVLTHSRACALGVSHPLDVLLSNRPTRLISSSIRSWDLSLQGIAPRMMPYVFSDAVTLMTFSGQAFTFAPSLQGFAHHAGPAHLDRLFIRPCCDDLLGLSLR
jgi:hypothetical protein